MTPNDGFLADSRAISEKEEIARAALRSLAETPAGPTNHSNSPQTSTGPISIPHAGPSTIPRSLSMTDEPRTGANSFFDNQLITSSPVSSPRLLPSGASGTRTVHAPSGDIASTSNLQESAIRRVSLLFRISTEEVRSILQHTGPLRASTMPYASQPQSSTRLSGTSPDLIHRLHDAYSYELQSLSNSSAGPTSDGHRMTSRSMGDIFDRASPLQARDEASRPQRSGVIPYRAASDIPPYRVQARTVPDPNHHTVMPPGPTRRPPSPSPFAFDPHRRPSHPVAQEMYPPESFRGPARYSLDAGSLRHPYSRPIPAAAYAISDAANLYPRKGRSIDDYLQQYPRADSHLAPRSGMHLVPGTADASPYYNARQDYGPYSTRSALAGTSVPVESSLSSPSLMEASRSTYIQRRSPRQSGATRSPSVAPSVASASRFTLSPSPVIDSSVAAIDAKPQARGREGSEESTDEAARVAGMRIEDKVSPAPFVGQLRRSSSNVSSALAASEVSHSEVMQRLQQRVKSRLAAKSRGENPDVAGTKGSTKVGRAGTPSKRTSAKPPQAQTPNGARRNADFESGSNKARKLSKASTAALSASPARNETPNSIAAALLSPTDSPTPTEAARNVAATQASRSGEDNTTVETASGQALPGDLPGAGQMNASSAAKQQTSMAGIDSLLQAAAASDPTESGHAIA